MTLFAYDFIKRGKVLFCTGPLYKFSNKGPVPKISKKKLKTTTGFIQNFLYFRTFLLIQSNISLKIGKNETLIIKS